MDRKEQSREVMRRLYGLAKSPMSATDPDFAAIKERLVYGEVYKHIKLDAKLREFILLAVAATNETPDEVELHTAAALSVGATPAQIKEAVYQSAPYIGMGKAEMAVKAVNRALAARGISLPAGERFGTVTEESRLDDGLATQKSIFGGSIDAMRESASEDTRHIQDYLSAWCFGDFYTRGGISVKDRELLTFSILCAQGGCEPQLRGHVGGNAAVGNGRDVLLDALTLIIPYIGFPRTLNALNVINELLPA